MPSIDEIKSCAVQHRAATIEDIDTGKSEMLVRAAPYGVPTDIGGGITEEFRPGTFARSAKAPHRLCVWNGHGGPLIGRGLEQEERADSVWVRARLSRTQAARDALLDIEDKISDQVSVEFVPMSDHYDVTAHAGGLNVVHRRATLLGFAIVPEGAYGKHSYIVSIREDDERERQLDEARLWLEHYKRRTFEQQAS